MTYENIKYFYFINAILEKYNKSIKDSIFKLVEKYENDYIIEKEKQT